MNDFLKQLFSVIKHLRYREQWVAKSGGALLAAIAGTSAYLLVNNLGNLNNEIKLVIVASVVMIISLVWLVVRYLYFRIGCDSKIGISYEGHRVPLDDWAYTRRKIAELFENGTLRKRVSLRLLPANFCNTDKKRKRASEKYGYCLILQVIASSSIENSNIVHFNLKLSAITKAKLDKEFIDATIQHTLSLINVSGKVQSISEALTMKANSLYDILLLNLGVLEAVDGQTDIGSACMRLLDSRINNKFKFDQQPRVAIRWMDFRCLTKQSQFAGGSPPGPDSLNEAIGKCQIAIDRYIEEYPELYHIQARNLFFANRIDESLPLATKALETAGNLHAKAMATLSLAVLHLLRSEFSTATNYFRDFFELKQVSKFNWKDLTEFADCSREFGYEHAVFIQALYRKIGGTDGLSAQLKSEVKDWLEADESRLQLHNIYKQHAHTNQQSNSKKQKKEHKTVKKKKNKRRKRRNR